MANDVARQGGWYVVIPGWVMRMQMPPRAFVLYATLTRYADNEGQSWPSRRTLARNMDCSLASVDRAVRELVALDLLTLHRRYDNDGSLTSTLYVLTSYDPTVTGGGTPKSDSALLSPVAQRTPPKELTTPLTPADAGEHAGRHPNCRACGTSRRQLAAKANEPPPMPAWCRLCDPTDRTYTDEGPPVVVTQCPDCHPRKVRR